MKGREEIQVKSGQIVVGEKEDDDGRVATATQNPEFKSVTRVRVSVCLPLI